MSGKYLWALGIHDRNSVSLGGGASSLEKPPDLDPFFDDLARAKSAKELKEHLETRVLCALLLTQVLRKGVQIWGLR